MSVHIITRRRLLEFGKTYTDAERPLKAWFALAKQARWQNLTEVRRDFPTADLVSRLTVFNIGGNKYRLVVRIEFERQRVYIRSIMTHAEYNKDKWKDDDWYA